MQREATAAELPNVSSTLVTNARHEHTSISVNQCPPDWLTLENKHQAAEKLVRDAKRHMKTTASCVQTRPLEAQRHVCLFAAVTSVNRLSETLVADLFLMNVPTQILLRRRGRLPL